MPKSRELNIGERHAIIAMYQRGVKPAEIARQIGIGDTTVRYVIKRYQASGSLNSAHRSGRPNYSTIVILDNLYELLRKTAKQFLTIYTRNSALKSQNGLFRGGS